MADVSFRAGEGKTLWSGHILAAGGSAEKIMEIAGPLPYAVSAYYNGSGAGTLQVKLYAWTGSDWVEVATGASNKVSLGAGYTARQFKVRIAETGAVANVTVNLEIATA